MNTDDDLKPRRDDPCPVRGWMIRRIDDDSALSERIATEEATWWRLFVEFDVPVLEVFGDFEELLKVARASGVEEYYVWSQSRRTYVQMRPADVHVPR